MIPVHLFYELFYKTFACVHRALYSSMISRDFPFYKIVVSLSHIQVGTEFVTQGRNKDQVVYSVSALAKATFDRMFTWLVRRVNKTLDTNAKRNYYIGVLDIAGFEIFDVSNFP